MRSIETIKEAAQKLVRQHRPADMLTLPEFMSPKVAAPITVSVPAPSPPRPDHSPRATPAPATAVTEGTAAPAKKLICAQCGIKIGYPEGKFC
jgi:hypothetical protein